MSAIEFRSVDKIYRGRRVIDSLSFMIEGGERIVLFGPSGCGKSTTLLLIAGLVAPDAGEIRIDGKVVSTVRRIHLAPQSRGRRHHRRRRKGLPLSAQLTWSTQAPALSARNEFSHNFGPGWASHIPARSSSRTSPLSTRLARFKTFAFLLSRWVMD